MRILIIGGFLGSGKTSIIRQLIQGLVNAGQTCAIIENEIGEVGIDDALLGDAELNITTLFGGCVCCQISGSLVSATEKIQEEINPDYLLIEMTGLALMDSIRQVFEDYGPSGIDILTVSVVDLSRWKHLVGALSHIFNNQISGADLIVLNKTDIAEPTEETYEVIKEHAPDAAIMKLEKADKEPDVLWAKFIQAFATHEKSSCHE